MYNTMVFRGYSGFKEHLKKCPKGSLIYNYILKDDDIGKNKMKKHFYSFF